MQTQQGCVGDGSLFAKGWFSAAWLVAVDRFVITCRLYLARLLRGLWLLLYFQSAQDWAVEPECEILVFTWSFEPLKLDVVKELLALRQGPVELREPVGMLGQHAVKELNWNYFSMDI